ncbi:hypothetical protein V6U77_29485 [Micromonospora sp. CPCC 205546]
MIDGGTNPAVVLSVVVAPEIDQKSASDRDHDRLPRGSARETEEPLMLER